MLSYVFLLILILAGMGGVCKHNPVYTHTHTKCNPCHVQRNLSNIMGFCGVPGGSNVVQYVASDPGLSRARRVSWQESLFRSRTKKCIMFNSPTCPIHLGHARKYPATIGFDPDERTNLEVSGEYVMSCLLQEHHDALLHVYQNLHTCGVMFACSQNGVQKPTDLEPSRCLLFSSPGNCFCTHLVSLCLIAVLVHTHVLCANYEQFPIQWEWMVVGPATKEAPVDLDAPTKQHNSCCDEGLG
jgi:hypothetical protein